MKKYGVVSRVPEVSVPYNLTLENAWVFLSSTPDLLPLARHRSLEKDGASWLSLNSIPSLRNISGSLPGMRIKRYTVSCTLHLLVPEHGIPSLRAHFRKNDLQLVGTFPVAWEHVAWPDT